MTTAIPTHASHALPFTVTAAAARRVAALAADAASRVLRVTVSGGGCAGFRYDFELAAAPTADDAVLERDGVTVLVDAQSMPYLDGATLDFEESLSGAHFVVRNPNAHGTCGCGSSFAA